MNHHHLVLLCFTIFSIETAYSQSKATVQAFYDDDATKTVIFVLKQPLDLKCNFSQAGQVQWRKSDKSVGDVPDLKDRFTIDAAGTVSKFQVAESVESDAGTYRCALLDENNKDIVSASFRVVKGTTKFAMKVAKNINVVEGEKLKIECQTKGEGVKGEGFNLYWMYENATTNFTLDKTMDRFILEHDSRNITNAVLLIEEVQMYDRGEYTCIAGTPGMEGMNATSTVRIKDKYAALWPFLGICAEVFVLCAIIFIYEKKRNKTELEESDTDQSPDQKNTPDHGKDSNLRHRQ